MWKHFHHQADIGIRGLGTSLERAFEEGAMALSAVICNPELVEPAEAVEIQCQADEMDLLFFDWINALICEMEIRRMLFSQFQVQIDHQTLTATAWGQSVDDEKHETAVAVKAATFYELKVFQDDHHHWIAQCVVDV